MCYLLKLKACCMLYSCYLLPLSWLLYAIQLLFVTTEVVTACRTVAICCHRDVAACHAVAYLLPHAVQLLFVAACHAVATCHAVAIGCRMPYSHLFVATEVVAACRAVAICCRMLCSCLFVATEVVAACCAVATYLLPHAVQLLICCH